MDNPLYDLWLKHGHGGDLLEAIRHDPPPGERDAYRVARDDGCHRYAWSVPNNAALDRIAACSPIVEVGAGLGYWAAQLASRGADVVAYDLHTAVKGGRTTVWFEAGAELWHPVRFGGARRAGHHPDRTLFLCWPPYGTAMANDALGAYESAGGRQLAFVGESSGGCTGDDAFFARLERGWTVVEEVDLPQWPGIHDYLTVYERS